MGVERPRAVLPTTTRAVIFHRPDDLRLESVPLPRLRAGELLIRVLACGLCASEVMDWYMERKAPTALGHEPVGEVVEVGAGVTKFAPGDRVFVHHHAPCMRCRYCRRADYVHCQTWRRSKLIPGGLSEFAVAPAEIVEGDTLPIPGNVSDYAAIFIEPLATVVKSLRRSGLRSGDRVLIIGLGVMGLLHAMLAKRLGATLVIGADRVPRRLAHSTQSGVDLSIAVSGDPRELAHAVRAATGDDGIDAVIVTPASIDAFEAGVASAAPGGTVVVFTPTEPQLRWPLDVYDAYFREISIIPSYSCGPQDTREALTLIRDGLPVESLITHRLSLDRAAEGYRLVRDAQAMKVVVRP